MVCCSEFHRSAERGFPVTAQINKARRTFLFEGCLLLITAVGISASVASDSPPPKSDNQAGVHYSRQEVKDIPWTIHILKVDRRRADMRWVSTMGQHTRLGMSLLSEQIKLLPANIGRPIAGINGDFYRTAANYPGDPEGVQIVEGELVSAPVPTRSCFWIDARGAPHMTNVTPRFTVQWPDGKEAPLLLNEERDASSVVLYTRANGDTTRCQQGLELLLERFDTNSPWAPLEIGRSYAAKVRSVNRSGNSPVGLQAPVLSIGPALAAKLPAITTGNLVRFSTLTSPDMAGARTAIGGGPALVHGGKALPFKGLQPRHPRSAVGWNDDFYFAVEVDGRQRHSAGMTLSELATYMMSLGCTEALNLDGGGSATLWVYGGVINSPSEGRERPSANGLVLVHSPAKTNAPASAP
jgi:hypothetical protein